MRNFITTGIVAGALTVSAVMPAFADVTAREVWDELKGYYESFGYYVEIGTENISGGVVTISQMTLTMQIPDEDEKVRATVDSLILRETGNGSVAIELPESSALAIQVVDNGDVEVQVNIAMDLENFEGLVSGALGNLRIENEGDSMSFKVSEVKAGDETIPVNISIVSGPFENDYRIEKIDDKRRAISGDYDIESMGVIAHVNEPDGDGFFNLTGTVASMESEFSGEFTTSEDPVEVLDAGLNIGVSMEMGASDFDVSFQVKNDRFAMTASAVDALFGFVLSPDVISYDIVEHGVEINISSSEIPIPAVNLNYDELEIGFAVPLSASEEPSEFNGVAALRGLEISEAIWSMIDPGQIIPRDPATIAIDISGKLMVLMDLMNLENLASLEDMDSPPYLPVAVDINELSAIFGGAELAGSGTMTFDPESSVIIQGVPLPVGEVNLSLKGGFGLMDKFSALGLVPAEASMGIRGMIGAFSKPVGEDHFETKVEMNADGSILANGQRIQ